MNVNLKKQINLSSKQSEILSNFSQKMDKLTLEIKSAEKVILVENIQSIGVSKTLFDHVVVDENATVIHGL